MSHARRPQAGARDEDPTRAADGSPGRSGLSRRGVIVVVLAVLILPFGMPRFLNHDTPDSEAHPLANFTRLCRAHGGTPHRPVDGKQAQCTVRYGGQVYVMDAITPRGFDADTAHFQRQGCESARLEEKTAGQGRQTYVYHPGTGVCEHRSGRR